MRDIDLILFNYASLRRILIAKWLEPRRDCTIACHGDVHCTANWCCYQLPLSHLMEGVLVASYLQKGGRLAAELPAIRKQGLVQHRMMIECLPWAAEALQAGNLEPAHERAEEFSRQWYDKREPCCFLAGGRCSVYQQRPVMCASFFVKDRCDRMPAPEDAVPMMDNTDLVRAVMDASDEAYSELCGANQMVAPVPFAYGVAAGAKLLTGQAVQCVEMR